MLDWIRAGWMITSFPMRLAWKGYSGLWWAFEEDAPKVRATSAPIAGQPAAPAAAVTVTPRKLPTKALKRGFVGTLTTSALGAWAMTVAHHQGSLSEPRALLGAAWIVVMSSVVTLLLVRRSERRRSLQAQRVGAIDSMKATARQAAARLTKNGLAAARMGAIKFAAASRLRSRFGRLVE